MSWDTEADGNGWVGERWIAVDTAKSEKARLQQERARINAARQKVVYPNRNHHGKKNTTDQRERRTMLKKDKLFIIWDGEGPRDTGYSLLGNSEGMEICYPTLSTLDCLNLVIDCERQYPDAIHIGFGFDYDVSNILRDLSWRHP